MKRKHIRTIIISALALLAAVTVIFNIDIEPKEQPSQSLAFSSLSAETKKPQAESAENDIEEPEKHEEENEKSPVPEKEKVTDETLPVENGPIKEKEGYDRKDAFHISLNEKTVSSEPARHFCTIEIRCDTVVDTSKLENQAVAPYIPKNGVILKAAEIEFAPGESVFDILLRATSERNIHLEFRDDNLYSGKYIEGINYLYEMDAGPLSGWMYKVNGKFPNYGCAAYKVSDKDAIVFVYTCDLGVDVGDNSTW